MPKKPPLVRAPERQEVVTPIAEVLGDAFPRLPEAVQSHLGDASGRSIRTGRSTVQVPEGWLRRVLLTLGGMVGVVFPQATTDAPCECFQNVTPTRDRHSTQFLGFTVGSARVTAAFSPGGEAGTLKGTFGPDGWIAGRCRLRAIEGGCAIDAERLHLFLGPVRLPFWGGFTFEERAADGLLIVRLTFRLFWWRALATMEATFPGDSA